MADENRDKRNDLTASFLHEVEKYGFYHALRLIECAYDDKPLIGQSRKASDDPIRFGQKLNMAFEPSTFSDYSVGKNGFPPRLNQYFLGLFGPNGPMPLHLTDYLQSRIIHHGDYTLARFADIFHHRMISLFYRARANTEPTINFDRPNNRFTHYVGALTGIGEEAFLNRDAMPDLAKYHYAGHFAHHAKNADGLKAIIKDFFQLPVKLEEFVGEWLTIENRDLSRLGSSMTATLGMTTIVGRYVWGCQHKFRLIFGPLTLSEYESLLPSGKRLTKLIAIIRNYMGYELQWDVNLILKAEEVQGMRLGGTQQLGWTSWLGLRTSAKDANPLVLNPLHESF